MRHACVVAATVMAVAMVSLAAGGCRAPGGAVALPAGAATVPPSALAARLSAELGRLAIDPRRAAAAPSAGNAVFDLQALLTDLDGSGPGQAVSVFLIWTERCVGDYDQNAEVNAADLAPLGAQFGGVVAYDTLAHGGIEWWPAGTPAGSGAANWRAARIDGDFNGQIGLSDVTPIAQHWHERLDGYRIYRRTAPAADFVRLANPADAAASVTVPRSAALASATGQPEGLRVLRYEFTDSLPGSGPYEYYVAAYDSASASEGPPSAVAVAQINQPPQAVLAAAPRVGLAPLQVEFDAAGSFDPEGDELEYAWDFDGDRLYEASSVQPAAQHRYDMPGVYNAGVLVRDSAGQHAQASLSVTVVAPGNNQPVAQLLPAAADAYIPLVVEFDATGSSAGGDAGDSIVQFDWDWEGDGAFDAFGSDPTVSHKYADPGQYNATVRVTDTVGNQALAVSDIVARPPNMAPPTAALAPEQIAGPAPLSVDFDASASHSADAASWIEQYQWDWEGDGVFDAFSLQPIAHHVYSYAEPTGVNAQVRVVDSNGNTAVATCAVTCQGSGGLTLTARLTASTDRLLTGEPVVLDASASTDSDGTIIFYQWDFDGDGTWDQTGGTVQTYTYDAQAAYYPAVQVTDDDLNRARAELQLVVTNTPWSMVGHDPLHTGRSGYVGPQTNHVKWTFSAPDDVFSPSIARDGTVYFSCRNGILYAINPDGTRKWDYDTHAYAIYTCPAIGADGTIYAGAQNNTFYALNPDGSIRWVGSANSPGFSSALVGPDGSVYVGGGIKLYAYEAAGALKWAYQGSNYSVYESAPALAASDLLVYGCDDENYYAVATDGREVWRVPAGGNVTSDPVIGRQREIYLRSWSDWLQAFTATGEELWHFGQLSSFDRNSEPAIGADGAIYLANGNRLWALNADGTSRWYYNLPGASWYSPSIGGDGTIYAGYADTVYALNPDGSLKWSFATGDDIYCAPAIAADGTLYIGSQDNHLYAFGP